MKILNVLQFCLGFLPLTVLSQQQWTDVSATFGSLPSSVKVFKSTTPINGRPSIAYYVKADLDSKSLLFDTDTTLNRRLTPQGFYEKNNEPLVVVNTSFFSFATNQNLNVVIKNRKLISYNVHSLPGRGKDTLTYRHPFGSAIGISKKGKADVAWLYTDSAASRALASQQVIAPRRDSLIRLEPKNIKQSHSSFKKWRMQTATGGGPVLLQQGEIHITNDEELKFAGKAIDDKHPRTAMGYTADGYLVIIVVQGRFPGLAEGASLTELANMLKDIGCVEALNLDGGGSSMMLVNGKETITPSDKEGQRPVPAVFIIRSK